MYNLKIHKKAKDTLDYLKIRSIKDLKSIIDSLDEISKKWLDSINIKNIWDWIYRKRVWRYRILMTFDRNIKKLLHIWIIDLEKDTKKDYKKWKWYIVKYITY